MDFVVRKINKTTKYACVRPFRRRIVKMKTHLFIFILYIFILKHRHPPHTRPVRRGNIFDICLHCAVGTKAQPVFWLVPLIFVQKNWMYIRTISCSLLLLLLCVATMVSGTVKRHNFFWLIVFINFFVSLPKLAVFTEDYEWKRFPMKYEEKTAKVILTVICRPKI